MKPRTAQPTAQLAAYSSKATTKAAPAVSPGTSGVSEKGVTASMMVPQIAVGTASIRPMR
ncbi:hypothetical protein ABTL04_19675 [Acinetobacter baumannii]